MTDQELTDGKLAYETHRRLTGDTLPDWNELRPQDKRAWALTAKMVIATDKWRGFASVFRVETKNEAQP